MSGEERARHYRELVDRLADDAAQGIDVGTEAATWAIAAELALVAAELGLMNRRAEAELERAEMIADARARRNNAGY